MADEEIKQSDLYETPKSVFDYLSMNYGPFDLDVCAEESTRKCEKWFGIDHSDPERRNALAIMWNMHGRRAWMNPPYSNPRPWIEHAILYGKFGLVTVALLPADTSTSWYHDLIKNNKRCLHELLPGRIRFMYRGDRQGSPKFGNIVAVFL